jgi:hypothetical protein
MASNATDQVVEASRGIITDRNGKVLVTNRKGYSIKLQKTELDNNQLNVMLLKLFNILENGVKYFGEPTIGALGGPGVTPPGDGFWATCGGCVYENIFVSGNYRYR